MRKGKKKKRCLEPRLICIKSIHPSFAHECYNNDTLTQRILNLIGR